MKCPRCGCDNAQDALSCGLCRSDLRKGGAGAAAPDNPRLRRAIESFDAEDSDENCREIFAALQEATPLLAAASLPPEAQSAPTGLPADMDLPLLTSATDDGRPVLLAFSSLSALQSRKPGAAWLAIPTAQLFEHVLLNGFAAVVFDPDGPSFAVTREIIADLVYDEPGGDT